MPHPRILRALNMTPAQWGGLPPEMGSIVGNGVQCTNERRDLREKAMTILAEEDAKTAAVRSSGGAETNKRLDNIEASIRGVSGDIGRRFEDVERRIGTMERGYDVMQKQVQGLHESEAKRAADHNKKDKS